MAPSLTYITPCTTSFHSPGLQGYLHFILQGFDFLGLQGRFLLGPSRHFSCHFTWGLKGLFFRGLQGLQLQFLSADVYGVFGKDTGLGSNQEREMRD